MKFTLGRSGDEHPETAPAGSKRNQTGMLVLLLLIVGGFAYVYFFTGIIKPQEAPKPPGPPAKAQMVKIPLPGPPPEGDAGKAAAKPAADAAKEVAQAPKAEPPKAPAAAAPPAAAKPLVQLPAKPAPAPVKQEPKKPEQPLKAKEEPKKAEPVKPAEKKPALAEKKPPVAARPEAPKNAAREAAASPKPRKAAKKEKRTEEEGDRSGSGQKWAILVGTYVLEEAMAIDMGRVRKAGCEPVVVTGGRKKLAMNRLFLAEFTDHAAAETALARLKKQTSDAFIIDHAGAFSVYAGSYVLDARAASELERLHAAGQKVVLKRAEVSIPSQNLTVGPFNSRKSAETALGKLKAAGIKAVISRQ